ncbi:hypothetical protein PCC9214_05495 (plasmid) [Planktothrix tepida]|nr:hypothetical protein PCC9214_05495 [Planktothrix tepida]
MYFLSLLITQFLGTVHTKILQINYPTLRYRSVETVLMVASTFCCYYVREKKTNLAASNNQAKVEKLKRKMYKYHSIDAGVCWGTSEEILPQFPISTNSSSLGQFPQFLCGLWGLLRIAIAIPKTTKLRNPKSGVAPELRCF